MSANKKRSVVKEPLRFCKGCGEQMTVPYKYCDRCAEKLQEYDYVQDDLNFDAAREKGR